MKQSSDVLFAQKNIFCNNIFLSKKFINYLRECNWLICFMVKNMVI